MAIKDNSTLESWNLSADFNIRAYETLQKLAIYAYRATKKLKNLVKEVVGILCEYQPDLEEEFKKSKIPRMDPKKPGVPLSFPLKTLEELESRSYFESFHYPFNKGSVPLPPSRASSLEERPRMLVCHDMKGGYVDDKWVQGNDNNDAFTLWHWHLMDVFVYFSHSLVSLPPPGWTNTAHRHGVKVLGTFLTEWDEGKRICEELLASKESAEMYANRLAELAVQLGFDGWLINMEVELNLEQVSHLKEFVEHLTDIQHRMLPGSLIIWYDSVTIDGKLEWQDQLTDKNKPFFDICDGIFLNYTWKEDYPKRSASVAGERCHDVYMGIDVFGRNTYGGGEWKTNVALDVAKKASTSVALFAPGWVYETNQGPNFQDANNRFWSLIAESWSVAQLYLEVLPFFSSFDQGHGKGIYIDGQLVSGNSWSNNSCQSFQPLLEVPLDLQKQQLQIFRNFEQAYKGGTCITFTCNMNEGDHAVVKLFQGGIQLKGSHDIAYSIKSEETSQFCIVLELSHGLAPRVLVFLLSDGSHVIYDCVPDKSVQLPRKCQLTSTIKNDDLRIPHAKSHLSNGWQLLKFDLTVVMDDWSLSTIYAIPYKGILNPLKISSVLKENNFVASSFSTEENELLGKQNIEFPETKDQLQGNMSSYSISLGHIAVSSMSCHDFLPPEGWSVSGSNVNWDMTNSGQRTLDIKLIWKLNTRWSIPTLTRYDIYVHKVIDASHGDSKANEHLLESAEHLGVAVVQTFYVSQLSVPSECKSIRFYVQPLNVSGDSQQLKDSPFVSITVPN